MSLRTMPVTIAARNIARRLGLTVPLAKLILGRSYEEAFDQALLNAIRPGDSVWDVGANVGYYSRKFAEAVGDSGRVYAFEPSPITAQRLRAAIGDDGRVAIIDKALGRTPARLQMVQGEDELGATSRIVADDESAVAMTIEVDSGDRLVEASEVAAPNVVKIDVEGHELDVLEGMRALLRESTLRAVCVEVHFQLLHERGQPGAASEIEKLLKSAGFRLRWTDPSHVVATRR